MCRSSGRGCTVMPCAPALIHVRAASVTLGIPIVRVFLINATLLRLTLSLVMTMFPLRGSSQIHGSRSGNKVNLFVTSSGMLLTRLGVTRISNRHKLRTMPSLFLKHASHSTNVLGRCPTTAANKTCAGPQAFDNACNKSCWIHSIYGHVINQLWLPRIGLCQNGQ